MRNDTSTGYLSLLRLNRTQAFELLLVGVVLGVGVNLLANYTSSQLSPKETLIAGALITMAAALFLLWRVLRPLPRVREFSGFFLYDGDKNTLASHDPQYELGSSLQRYMDAAFAENTSIKAIWDSNPISGLTSSGNALAGDPDKSLELVRQATEYFLLRSFSNRLSEHFASGDYDSDELDTYSHTDLPDFLLQNRFLRTFAEPMEERAAFLPEVPGSSQDYKVVAATSAAGAIYERFELVLPKGWGVRRSAENQMEIHTTRFALTIVIRSEGWGTLLPSTYIPDYLGLQEDSGRPDMRYSEMGIEVSITIAPQRAWLPGRMVWKNYRWIDRWIADLKPQISQSAYLEKIGYASAETTYRLMRSLQESSSTTPTDDENTASVAIVEDFGEDDRRPRGGRPPFEAGDRIEHASFGVGTAIGIEPGGVVIVKFDDHDAGTKKFMADYAPMRRI